MAANGKWSHHQKVIAGSQIYTDILEIGCTSVEIFWRRPFRCDGRKTPYKFLGGFYHGDIQKDIKTAKAVIEILHNNDEETSK